MHNLSCENEFYFHENEKWFPYQMLSTYPCFETEAWGNSEMAYYFVLRTLFKWPKFISYEEILSHYNLLVDTIKYRCRLQALILTFKRCPNYISSIILWMLILVLGIEIGKINSSFKIACVASISFAPFPLPPHSFFFLLSSQLSWRTRAETLAMQASFKRALIL